MKPSLPLLHCRGSPRHPPSATLPQSAPQELLSPPSSLLAPPPSYTHRCSSTTRAKKSRSLPVSVCWKAMSVLHPARRNQRARPDPSHNFAHPARPVPARRSSKTGQEHAADPLRVSCTETRRSDVQLPPEISPARSALYAFLAALSMRSLNTFIRMVARRESIPPTSLRREPRPHLRRWSPSGEERLATVFTTTCGAQTPPVNARGERQLANQNRAQ